MHTRKLYETFGELIYVIAMADGKIQPEELDIIEQRLSNHPWGKEIKWSFDYEVQKENSIDYLYKKVIDYCQLHGPDEEYDFLIQTLHDVAASSNGIDAKEQKVMDGFVNELIIQFKKDLSLINQEA